MAAEDGFGGLLGGVRSGDHAGADRPDRLVQNRRPTPPNRWSSIPDRGGKLGLVTGTVSLNGMTADEDWQVDRLREDGDPNHDSDIQRAVDKANKAREQGADVVAIAMHSVQEYLDYADSWQISEAHELADTGAFDVIYGAGCHCAQPIENYNGTWIIYGLGNAVTESANTPENLGQQSRV